LDAAENIHLEDKIALLVMALT